MNKARKIWNLLSTLIVVLVAVLAIALVGVRLIGLQVFTVLSGSMEPEYPVGSLIYVKEVDYKQLEAGDVITYMLDQDTVDAVQYSGCDLVLYTCTYGGENRTAVFCDRK